VKKTVEAPSSSPSSGSSSGGMGVALYAVVLLGGAVAYGAYQYMQAQQKK
jgi:cytochrome b5